MIAAALTVALLAAGEPFAWPLDRPRVLTSSFAEYRPGRFHAGIDLRTGGIGLPVRAAGDGHVSRVRCSPHGYGKAVYLQLDSGHNVVYAHLDDFYEPLRAYVREAQHAARDYTVDLHPAAGRFRVRRGEVVAFSGNTGIGAPHLHYEIREGSNPVNPRLLGIDWPDTTPPVIHRVVVAPRPPHGRVNGDVFPVVLDAAPTAGGRHTTAPLRVDGDFMVGVDFIDPVEGGARLGAHTIRLVDGGLDRFLVRHDRLDYADSHNAVVSYHPYLLDRGRFLLLHRWPGNRSSSYAHSPGDGWTPGDAARALRVEVADFHGNTATVEIPVAPGAPGLDPVEPDEATAARLTLDTHGNALIATWTADGPVTTPPAFRMEPQGAVSTLRVDARAYRAVWVPERDGPHRIVAAHPRLGELEDTVDVFLRGRAGTRADAGLRIAAAADSAYGMLFARVAPEDPPPSAPVPGRGAAWRVWPEAAPIDAPVTISLPLPPDTVDPAKAGIYRHDGKRWIPERSRLEGGWLRAETRRFGVFRVLEDSRAPHLGGLVPEEGEALASRRPRIAASVRDVGSGIAKAEAFCGDRWLLMAYDPEADRMVWEADHDLPPGPQTIRFRAVDHAGNETVATRRVTVP